MMRCDNCGWLNPYGAQKCEKCGNSMEKEKLKSQLEDLRKDPPSFPPSENAMCYCQMPPDWREHDNDDGDEGNGLFHKVLIILAIIVVVAIAIAIVLV